MKTKNQNDVPVISVNMDGAYKAGIQVLISVEDGAPNFAMRRFTIAPEGHTPLHRHDNEHEIFVLSGKGKLVYEDNEYPLMPGSFALVDPGALHQFRNTGEEDFVFICVVPNTTNCVVPKKQ
jgi:quercetin dioxygenase-like cupin family protein